MRAVGWVLVATAAARILTFAALAALARLLAPADFGLLAFALVYITYVETVGDLGTGMALIYWPARREEAAQVAFVLNLAMGLFWLALTLLAAPGVAGFFGNAAGADVLRALAWTFPLKALGNTHDALCQKDLRFKARLAPELAQAATKAVVSVAAAVGGFGVWSLVWGQLAGTAAWTALQWRVVPWRPRAAWPGGLIAPMLAYGRGIVAVNMLAAVVHHADLIVVGRALGATALGLYHVAYKVPETAVIIVVWAVSRVLFPALSRARAEGRPPADTYLSALRYSALFTVPASVAVALLAEPLVLVLFGAPWAAAAPIMSVLAISAGLRSLGSHAGDVLKAAGRPGLLAALGAVRALVLVPALVLAARWGATAVAVAMAAVTGAMLAVAVVVAGRVAGIPLRAVAAAVRGSLIAGTLVGAALLAWTSATAPATDAASLALALGVGGIAYAAALWWACPEALALIPRGRKRDGVAPIFGLAGGYRVPLEPGPLGYLREALLVPYGMRERLACALPSGIGMRLLVRPRRSFPPAVDTLADALARPSSGLLQHTPLEGRSDLRAIVKGEASAGRNRLVAFVFGHGDRRPLAVVKMRRMGGAGASLRGEWEALCRIAELPPPLATMAPRPLALREWEDAEVLALTWLPGRSARVEMHSALRPEHALSRHFEDAARWLGRFHAATRSTAVDAFGWPLSAAHGDFWSHNLLWNRGQLAAVVDWEHFRPEAPVHDDLFHFPLTYGLAFTGARRRALAPEVAFRRTFLEDGPLCRAVALYLRVYCAETGLPAAALPARLAAHFTTGRSRHPADTAQARRFQSLVSGAEPSALWGLLIEGARGPRPAGVRA